jgi:two-component system, response regulator
MTDSADVLIVEDNPNDLELTLRSLKKCGVPHSIHIAKDGVEALDFLFARGPFAGRSASPALRLILLDHKLPKIDGMEVLRQVKSNERMKVIPVVMLTSSQHERDVVESYRLGVNSYIVKPVDFAKFGETIACLGIYWLTFNYSIH